MIQTPELSRDLDRAASCLTSVQGEVRWARDSDSLGAALAASVEGAAWCWYTAEPLVLRAVHSAQRGVAATPLPPLRALPPPARLAMEFDPQPAATVITSAEAWVAESGSIALADGDHRGARVTALAAHHVVIVDSECVVPRLEDGLARVRHAKSSVLVTGPSRTADIEKTLIVGMHGPRRLTVICLL